MPETNPKSEISEACHARLTFSKTNPYLECIIETNPDALEIAKNLDEERQRGQIRGSLHGIPVLVKDVGLQAFSHSDRPTKCPLMISFRCSKSYLA